MKTSVTVKKWGNSLAIRIPLSVAIELGLSDDSQLQLNSDGKKLILKPKNPQTLNLEALLQSITPENNHLIVDWGEETGNEIW
ncbi:MAG: AbrB/MazE/SpoVT family DNA-binding domain-containing protein [Candidatus Saccharimonadia bacterium]